VTKIIDAIVSDDQLDDCDLTLRELTQIRESMIRSLVAIYHSRIDYPGYTPPASGQFRMVETEAGADLKAVGNGDAEPQGGKFKYKTPSEIPVSPGGEVEDEAVQHPSGPKG